MQQAQALQRQQAAEALQLQAKQALHQQELDYQLQQQHAAELLHQAQVSAALASTAEQTNQWVQLEHPESTALQALADAWAFWNSPAGKEIKVPERPVGVTNEDWIIFCHRQWQDLQTDLELQKITTTNTTQDELAHAEVKPPELNRGRTPARESACKPFRKRPPTWRPLG